MTDRTDRVGNTILSMKVSLGFAQVTLTTKVKSNSEAKLLVRILYHSDDEQKCNESAMSVFVFTCS